VVYILLPQGVYEGPTLISYTALKRTIALSIRDTLQPEKKKNWKEVAKEKLHFDAQQCPCCKTGKMRTILTFEANAPPPLWLMKKYREQQMKTGT